jgi:hypothetical protein
VQIISNTKITINFFTLRPAKCQVRGIALTEDGTSDNGLAVSSTAQLRIGSNLSMEHWWNDYWKAKLFEILTVNYKKVKKGCCRCHNMEITSAAQNYL